MDVPCVTADWALDIYREIKIRAGLAEMILYDLDKNLSTSELPKLMLKHNS